MVTIIVFLPLLTAVALLAFNDNKEEIIRRTALGASVLTFLLSLGLFFGFDETTADFQFVERHTWIQNFGIEYYVGTVSYTHLTQPTILLV